MIYYNHENSAFYDTDINSEIPDKSIEISESLHTELLKGLSSGRQIALDNNGTPQIVDKPEDLSFASNIERSWRDSELQIADIELYKVQDSDPKASATVGDWRAYRKALRAWPEHPNFPDKSFRPTRP